MAATIFLPGNLRLPQKRASTNYSLTRNGLMAKRVVIKAQQGDSERKSIDENMIVLRMRIKKMKAVEGGEGVAAAAPSFEWEKRVSTEGACDCDDSMEMLQWHARPSVALGMVALIAAIISNSVVVDNAIKLARGLLAGFHVSIDIDF